MSSEQERRNLTFSQRDGKVPLPETLCVGKLPRKFRKALWKEIDDSVSNNHDLPRDYVYGEEVLIEYAEMGIVPPATYMVFNETRVGKFWQNCSHSYYYNLLDQNHDEIFSHGPGFATDFNKAMREIILHGEYYKVLDVVEHILRTPNIPSKLANSIKNTFEYAPYFADSSMKPICIIPTTSEEMKESAQQSLDNINKSELTGAKHHLREAAQELNDCKFTDSIRESIHAVVSAAIVIAPDATKNLSPALDALEKHGILIHPALNAAFKKLYGYTSSEQGIRHPFIDEKSDAAVGIDEALFMYGACVSFVDYLVNKKRAMDKIDES